MVRDRHAKVWLGAIGVHAAFAIGLAALVFGCGAPTSVESGIDVHRQASSLTGSERADLCNAWLDYSSAHMNEERYCYGRAQATAQLAFVEGEDTMGIRAACEEARIVCSEDYANSSSGGDLVSCSFGQGCAGTVGEGEQCLTAITDELYERADAWSGDCSVFTEAFFADDATTPDACVLFNETCSSGN